MDVLYRMLSNGLVDVSEKNDLKLYHEFRVNAANIVNALGAVDTWGLRLLVKRDKEISTKKFRIDPFMDLPDIEFLEE